MDEKKAIQKDKLRAAPLIKLNVGDLTNRAHERTRRTNEPAAAVRRLDSNYEIV